MLVARQPEAADAAGVQTPPAQAEDALKIGSKRFTESYILGELLLRTASGGGPAVHKPGLGNTGILYEALRSGAIDFSMEGPVTMRSAISCG